MTGKFAVVGIGPGDPELITLKAARLIGDAPVVAYHAGVSKQSHARRIASSLIPADAIEEELRYPVTTGTTAHPGGYVGAMAEFYESCAVRLSSVVAPATLRAWPTRPPTGSGRRSRWAYPSWSGGAPPRWPVIPSRCRSRCRERWRSCS